jgi:hypothetical protein
VKKYEKVKTKRGKRKRKEEKKVPIGKLDAKRVN